jgi:peptidoglycan/LPS O-acetylase OafA/YrhL
MATVSRLEAARDNNFDLIRHIAAIGVLISHAFPLALGRDHPDPLQGPLNGVTIGSLCVAAFFAISGFLVTASWQRFETRGGCRGFLVARSLRIFPGLAMAALFTVALGSMLTTAPVMTYLRGATEYVLRTVMLVSVAQRLPGVFETNPMDSTVNGSLWTLFYELTLYVGVAVAGLCALLPRKRLALLILPLLLALYVISSQSHISDRIHSISLLGIPFGVGMLAWLWRNEIRFNAAWVLISWLLAWVCLDSAISEPVLYVAVAISSLYLGTLREFPVRWPSRWGDMSYGIYIYAFPVQQTAASFGVRDPLLGILVALPVTLILAALSWRFVENPALSLKRALAARHQ